MLSPRSAPVIKQAAPRQDFRVLIVTVRLLLTSAIAFTVLITAACNLASQGSSNSTQASSHFLTVTGNLPSAITGRLYNSALAVHGGSGRYEFALNSGSLPDGLTLSSSTGTISGMTFGSGIYGFGVVVRDLALGSHGYKYLSLNVARTAALVQLTITPSSVALNSGAKQQFSASVSGTSNRVMWSTSSGTISPAGLFTAPVVNEDTNVRVVATSATDPTQKAVASFLVYGAVSTGGGGEPPLTGPDNRYCGPGNQPDFGGTMDGPATLPNRCFYTALSATPSPGAVTPLAAGSDLQGAIDNAKCGDTLMLTAGGVWATGKLTFPAKNCDDQHWITIRTSAPDSALPAEGARMTPCYAGVGSLPGRPALNCSSTENVMAKIEYSGHNSGPIIFGPGASHYRLIGLEVTKQTAGTFVDALASAAAGAAYDHVIFDRVWFHGQATDETTRGVQLGGSAYVAVIDSYFSDFHCQTMGNCMDAQAVSGGNAIFAMGPYKIVDNFLESSGENILFGGSASDYVPADIEIRRNHFFKPLTWMRGQPGFVGATFIVKNHLEFKNGQRALVEGNIMENSWGGFTQDGFSVLLTPKNNGQCAPCQVTDITFRYNTIHHVGGVFQIANALSAAGVAAKDGQRYSIHDVIADDISPTKYVGHGVFAQISMEINPATVPLLQNVTIDHVTAFPEKTLINVGGPNNPPMGNFVFTNNIVTAGSTPIWSTGGGPSNCAYLDVPTTTLNACFSSLTFSENVIVAQPSNYTSAMWPPGNGFAGTLAALGLVTSSGTSQYQLAPTSRFKSSTPQGTDPGADVNRVGQETAGVN